MQGTWGRRIFGRIWTADEVRWFVLEMETRDGDVLTVKGHVYSEDLNANPWLYKIILDQLVQELERKLRAQQ